MALVTMVRAVPEVPNGPTRLELPESDVPVLEKRGWTVEPKKAGEPKPEKAGAEKPSDPKKKGGGKFSNIDGEEKQKGSGEKPLSEGLF